MGNELKKINELKLLLNSQYKNQIINFLGNEKNALKFLSSIVSACQRIPKLLECEQNSVINSFLRMAELGLMPSDVSGEAYVLPYDNKKKIKDEKGNDKWIVVTEAQFQLGYQGLVTLFYKAGVKSIVAEIVYKKDKFSVKNGEINHEPDYFSERGEPIGAYVIVTTQQGGKISKIMKKDDILSVGQKFSKSYYEYDFKSKQKTTNLGKYTPWNPKNDPELWMWKKTVLKQIAKLVPKNETIFKAIDFDNKDSIIEERKNIINNDDFKKAKENLKMGNFIKKEITDDEIPVINLDNYDQQEEK